MTIDVQADVISVLSYAMAHNRIPVVQRLAMRNRGAEAVSLSVSLVVEDAEGVLSDPFTRDLALAAGEAVSLDDIDLTLTPSKMLLVEEQRPGRLKVTAMAADGRQIERHFDLRLLSAMQWLAVPEPLSYELLAAFVLPNDPAIGRLMSEVADCLLASTGSSSIEGYQSGTERVDAIAEAVYEAMAARDIRYVEPPASWADVGQKIRTPSEVLEDRFGTCLDTVVVMAAALEQAGIRPVLWLVEAHAFLGYWRQESALDAVVETEIATVVNLLDLGQMRLVETTALTGGPAAKPFAQTSHPPRAKFLSDDLSRAHAVIDVWAARRGRIIPLPARTRGADGTVHVSEYRPAEHSRPVHVYTAPARPVAGESELTPPRVQQWKNALLDLSLRNRLINFSERTSIALGVPRGGLGTLEDLINARQAIQILPSDPLDEIQVARGGRNAPEAASAQMLDLLDRQHAVFSSVPDTSYASRFRSLAYKARTIVEETGANNLYVALGTLSWSLDGRALRSPLILVPVFLAAKGRTGRYQMSLDESGTSTPNYCLLEKLRQVHGLEIAGLANPVEDHSGIDLDAALQATREAIKIADLPYRVEESADLVILQFAKFRLWKDLDDHWPELMQNALVKHLVATPTEPFDDGKSEQALPDLDALDARCPIPADSSQLEAIAKATLGRTFVLEGPPGTGKSQTITNLLTRAIADGRKVLFVAEKRAALDVVQKRLRAVGMGPFCLDLHDKASKPGAVREQVKLALDHTVQVDAQGFKAAADDLASSRGLLARYADRLHECNEAGLSFYSARTQLLTVGDVPVPLPVPSQLLTGLTPETLRELRTALQTLPDSAELTQPRPAHPWGFADPDQPITEAELPAVMSAARDVTASMARLPRGGTLGSAIAAAASPGHLTALSALADNHLPLDVLDQAGTPEWAAATSSLAGDVAAFVAAAHPGLDVAAPQALDLPLADLHARATAAATSGFFGRKKRLRAVLEELRPGLRPGAEVPPKRVLELTSALLQVQGAVAGLGHRANSVAGLRIPPRWNPLTEAGTSVLARQVEWLKWAGSVVRLAPGAETTGTSSAFSTAVRTYLNAPSGGDLDSPSYLRKAAVALQDFASASRSTDEGVWRTWCGTAGLVQRWETTAGDRGEADLQMLPGRRWIGFLEALAPLRRHGLHEARVLLRDGTCHCEDAVRAFEHGLAFTSLRERAVATGLDAFDAERHLRTVNRFERTTRSVRTALVGVVPAEVLANRPFQAGAQRGQVGALSRELAKQRRGLGVRKLLEVYGPLITDVMPCVLVSPDSVARFFPVGAQFFDMVVFDEASQIRVADAVGAMGRSKSVVVVGDSKQMPPTALFAESTTTSDDEADSDSTVVEDEESILSECVQARVDRCWLSWHYRSVDESLIAFSNQRYYDGKLSSFPGPATPGRLRPDAGISLIRIDGIFQRSGRGKLLRTSDAEARAVVSEIKRRFAGSPEEVPSIGVITFNQQQRAHIESIIRDEGGDRLVEALDQIEGEGLFIKNLENVQGDERDVILFSTAFSANDKGVVPLNFGPLNRGGGERRLNVAITRARRQVIVFSSFDPSMLRADETISVGIKHLRAYLDLAAHGTQVLSGAQQARTSVDRHREEIADALRREGLVVHTDVGLSDFKVDLAVATADDPDQPVMAVLLDGPGWAARRTVNDRDGLPSSVLVGIMRWPVVERVWAPAWVTDPASVLARLSKAIADAPKPCDQPGRIPPAVANAATLPVVPKSTPKRPEPALLAGEESYVVWATADLGTKEWLDALPDPRARDRVRSALEAAVAAEGPIHLDVLAKRVAAAFQLRRVSAGRIQAIVSVLPRDLVPDRSTPFAWPRDKTPGTWAGFRRPRADEPRPLETVSLEEIANAMVALCADCGGMATDELLREALGVFGGKRMMQDVNDRLRSSLALTVERERLTVRSGVHYAT